MAVIHIKKLRGEEEMQAEKVHAQRRKRSFRFLHSNIQSQKTVAQGLQVPGQSMCEEEGYSSSST